MTESVRSLPALIVLAKAPEPGRSKTRLSPPCDPEEAADIARAALEATLQVVLATPASAHVLVLDGSTDTWLPDGFRVIGQRGDGLDQRLAAAFEDAPTPALLIGMDTPQIDVPLLESAMASMSGGDAVLGAAEDDGYWAIGLHEPRRDLFEGVPMSDPNTLHAQRARFDELGLPVRALPKLRDVDSFEDALAIAETDPASSFAEAVRGIDVPRERRRQRIITASCLIGWLALFITTWLWGNAINDARGARTDMLVQAPPLTGHYRWGLTAGILVAVAFAGAAVSMGPWIARRVSWRTLLWVSFLASAAWILALALGDPVKHISSSVRHHEDYLRGVSFIGGDLPAYLRSFTERIAEYPAHVRSHPPGLVTLLWGLRQAGMGAADIAAALMVVGGAAATPAVVLATREVAGERRARRMAPFLILAPAALWMGTSADALYAGVGAWAVTLLVLALSPRRSSRRRMALALAGGTLFGLGIFLSYGFALLAVIPAVVAWKRRSWQPLAIATLPVLIVIAAWAAAGFWWLAGLAATRQQYALGIAQDRPYSYFLFADLAVLGVAIGPAAVVGLARLQGRAWWLVGGALGAVALADVSGMSKAEVERIWLPFAVWIMVACAPLGKAKWSGRGWLALSCALAILLQVGLDSPW